MAAAVLLILGAGGGLAQSMLPFAGEAETQAFRREMSRHFHAAWNMNRATVIGDRQWLFPRGEIRFLSTEIFWGEKAKETARATRPNPADPVPAILDFHTALSEKGIELILLPVPAKGTVYPEYISGLIEEKDPFIRFDIPLQAFLKKLTEAGVSVIDLVPPFVAAKTAGRPMYCRTDSHWSPAACEIAAQLLAEKLKAGRGFTGTANIDCGQKTIRRVLRGDLAGGLNDPALPPDTLEMNRIGIRHGDEIKAFEEDRNSPVLLMGDSHVLVFHDPQLFGSEAGLFDHLSARLGFPVDLIGTRGTGTTHVRIELFRRQQVARQSGGDYLAAKQVIIWCFSARQFTESETGWRVVPLEK